MSARPSTLLVEDNSRFGEALSKALQARSLHTDWVRGWEEGLELFRVNGYELVISDYNLPKTQHGLQLLARMKMLIPSSKLVLISGALTPSAERSLADVDLIDDYVSKDDAEFTAKIAQLVEQADEAAARPTNWKAFGSGYVADLDRDFPQVEKIDQLLRVQVESDG